jgi:hypothetical protein
VKSKNKAEANIKRGACRSDHTTKNLLRGFTNKKNTGNNTVRISCGRFGSIFARVLLAYTPSVPSIVTVKNNHLLEETHPFIGTAC